MSKLLAVGLFVLSAAAPGGTVAGGTRPDWISGCVASTYNTRYYYAKCSSGNARYFSRATCYRPKVGRYTDYGDYVWPRTVSYGSCPSGYIASNPGWTQ